MLMGLWLRFWLLVLLLWFVVAKSNNSTTKSQWVFSQSDYDVKWEIADLSACNYSYFRDPKANMVPFNRTLRVFNASFQLLQVLSKDLKLDVQVYKFMSNEYRFFPITVSVNPCVEYDLNSFNFKNLLRNISNIHSCPLQKGLYYIRNGLPDYSKLPPHIPRGQYKMTTKWYHKSDFLAQLDLYATVKDKPLKWW